ncbi:hypothetical protein [Marinimicrobium locisalis]|uniref:hypothetical protein n=1 Tax=Marinimicrobium locisalis TaxID=546022 RepID=UPI003221F827
MIKKIAVFLAGIAVAGGVWMLGVSAKYGVSFLSKPESATRYEYLQGVALAAILAVPFWLIASFMAWAADSGPPKTLRLGVYTVTIALCVSILAFTVMPVVITVLSGG